MAENDSLLVNKVSGKPGEALEISEVLLKVDGEKVIIGKPLVEKAKIITKVIEHRQGKKVRIAKFKAKTGYRRVTGFRPQLTLLKVEKIV